MIHFAQNNDIIIGVDFGYGNDIAVKTTAKVHEDGRLEILKSERIRNILEKAFTIGLVMSLANPQSAKQLVMRIKGIR